MEKYEVDRQHDKVQMQSLGLKVLLCLIGLSIVGTIVCVILAVLRVAVEGMVITAGVLTVLVLCGIVGYNAVKYKVKAAEYHRQLEHARSKDAPQQ